MCVHGCLLPNMIDGLCPIHYLRNPKNSKFLNTVDFQVGLKRWIDDNYNYGSYVDGDGCKCDGDEAEVRLRNLALHYIYGNLPSYAYFTSFNEFREYDWCDWWLAILKDVKCKVD